MLYIKKIEKDQWGPSSSTDRFFIDTLDLRGGNPR